MMYAFRGVGPTRAARIIAYLRAAGYPARKVGRGSAIRPGRLGRGSLALGSPALLSAMAALAPRVIAG